MNAPLSEAEARRLLAEAEPTTSTLVYRASRLKGGGWYFGLESQDIEGRVGGSDWIVADNSVVRGMHFSDDIGQVLERLLAEDP